MQPTTPFFSAEEEQELCPHEPIIPGREEIYIFGAGHTGTELLGRLRRLGMPVAGFIDNNPGLAGSEVEGVKVSPPAAVAKKYSDALIVAASSWPEGIVKQCRELGLANVLLLGQFNRRLDLHNELSIMANGSDAAKALDLWSDSESRDVYRALVRHRITFDPKDLPPCDPRQYFPEGMFSLEHLCALADCGAHTGDTLGYFRNVTNNAYEHYYGFEPDPDNFAALVKEADNDPRVKLFPVAVGDRPGRIGFSASLLKSMSRISETGNMEVAVDTLDHLLGDAPVTFLKMDVEGYEPQALEGARNLIAAQRPALAISVYHKAEHLWSLPLWIMGHDDRYRLKLRHHLEGSHGETVCYAVP